MLYAAPEFKDGNIPVIVAASIMGKDKMFVREAMKRGIIDLGVCFKKEGSDQYDFYISPFKLWQLTGYVYQGGTRLSCRSYRNVRRPKKISLC